MKKDENEPAKVEFVLTRSQLPQQFGKGLLYVQDGRKQRVSLVLARRWFKFLSPAITLALLLKPNNRTSKWALPGTAVSSPHELTGSPPIQIPRLGDGAGLNDDGSHSRRGEPVHLSGPHVIARSPGAKIPPGWMVKARLVSGASNGPVRAELLEDLVVNGSTLAPTGALLLGSGSSTEERLYVRFSKLVFQDGRFQSISAEALEESDQIAGLKGSKVGHFATRLAAGIGLHFVGGMSEGLQDTRGENGAAVKKPTLKNALLNGSEQAAIEEGNELLSNLHNELPVIEVKAGSVITVLFSEGGSS